MCKNKICVLDEKCTEKYANKVFETETISVFILKIYLLLSFQYNLQISVPSFLFLSPSQTYFIYITSLVRLFPKSFRTNTTKMAISLEINLTIFNQLETHTYIFAYDKLTNYALIITNPKIHNFFLKKNLNNSNSSTIDNFFCISQAGSVSFTLRRQLFCIVSPNIPHFGNFF